MRKDDLISMSCDVASLLIARVGAKKIRRVILFGSVARGDFDNGSDIDLFIDVESNPTRKLDQEVKAQAVECLNSFDAIRKRRWDLKGITLPVKVTVGDLEEKQWKHLADEMEDHGILLFGPFNRAVEKSHLLVTFDAKAMPPARRMRLARRLFGYSIKKEGKVYPQEGLIGRESGFRLGPSSFIVPLRSKSAVESLFRETPVRWQGRKVVW